MGRILALDFGTKRVGAAISDPDRSLASPLEVYLRRTDALDAAHYRALVIEERVEQIVIGLPVHTSGHESAMSALARAWGNRLQTSCGVPVVYFDERYTSHEAESRLRDAGLRGKALKQRVDMLAAHALLQAYLDAGCPNTTIAPGAIDDRDD